MQRLLIAEHLEEFRILLYEALSQKYQVTICGNGKSTLNLLNSLHPDILILDLALPELDGLTVLKQSQYLPPVVLCTTTFWSDQIIQVASDLGVGYILLKPCTIDTMLKRLNEIVFLTNDEI